ADVDHVRIALRDSRGDGPDPRLRDELHRHLRPRVDALQVIDELRQILDAVDIVVRRRRDQRHPRHRVPDAGDLLRDLEARNLAALARLRALRHFDLELRRDRQVLRGDTEAPRGDLLDLAVAPIPVRIGVEADAVFPALAAVAL